MRRPDQPKRKQIYRDNPFPGAAVNVHISDIPGINPEQFNRIEFDGQFVPDDAVVGEVGGGWQLINEALALERTGIYFHGRAQRWTDLLGLFEIPGHLEEELNAIRAELPVARLVAWRCIHLLAQGEEHRRRGRREVVVQRTGFARGQTGLAPRR